MYIDRRYKGRRKRSPWPYVFLVVLVLIPGIYFLATRTRFFENPFNPLAPTATPTRSAVSYLAEAEDEYRAGRLTAAAEGYQRVVELEPDNDEGYNRVAWLWILRGHPERAVEPARKAVELNESAWNLAILAMALDWTGDYDEAIKVALKAVDVDRQSAEAHAALAEAYADRNNWTRTGRGVRPRNSTPRARSSSATWATCCRCRAGTRKHWRRTRAPRSWSRRWATSTSARQHPHGPGRIRPCHRAVRESYDRQPGCRPGTMRSATPARSTATRTGRSQYWKRQSRSIRSMCPAHAHPGLRQTWPRLNWESAIENFEKAFSLAGESEEFYYMLGLSYSYPEDRDNALIRLNKALELNPESRLVLDGIRRCGS